jgi:hypothetical protein
MQPGILFDAFTLNCSQSASYESSTALNPLFCARFSAGEELRAIRKQFAVPNLKVGRLTASVLGIN